MSAKIKIIDPGTGSKDVKILNAETGQPIPGAYAYEICGRVGEPSVVRLHCFAELEVVAGEVKDITEFGDEWRKHVRVPTTPAIQPEA